VDVGASDGRRGWDGEDDGSDEREEASLARDPPGVWDSGIGSNR